MRTLRALRVAVGLVTLAVSLALVAPPSATAATSQLTATTTVNIRRSASTSSAVLGQLERGQTVTATANRKGWATIRFAGTKAYVSSQYLSKSTTIAVRVKVAVGSVRTATTALNVRKGAGTTYKVVTVLADGARVTMTGKSSKGFGQVVSGTTVGWASLKYLASLRGALPAAVGVRVATAALDIRTSDGASAKTVGEVKKGTQLSITGVQSKGRAQVIFRGAARWVTAKYLATPGNSLPPPPSLPKVIGIRYATAELNIRSTYKDDYTLITEVPVGTALSITGVVKQGRMQIVFANAVRWVTAKYLSTKPPTTAPAPGGTYAVEKGLKPNAIKVHRALRARYPQITTYYGVRPDPIPDHPSGRALDVIIPNYKSAAGKDLGYDVAGWLKDNAKTLGIQYIIWNQHIWNIQRDDDGWRYMANRGSDSANHKNHVHVTVYS